MNEDTTERLIQAIQGLGLLVAAVVLAFGGFDVLASTAMGGALALIVPTRVPRGGAVALGLVCGGLAGALAPTLS